MEYRDRRRTPPPTTVTALDVDDALKGERESGGVGLPRPDLDQDDGDEHADPSGFGREAAWPEPERPSRVAQIGCDLRPLDASRPAAVVTPSDQLAWQGLGGAAAEETGR